VFAAAANEVPTTEVLPTPAGFDAELAFAAAEDVAPTTKVLPTTGALGGKFAFAAMDVVPNTDGLHTPAGCPEFPAPSSVCGKCRRVRLSLTFAISKEN
jgi:hypothetical protein